MHTVEGKKNDQSTAFDRKSFYQIERFIALIFAKCLQNYTECQLNHNLGIVCPRQERHYGM